MTLLPCYQNYKNSSHLRITILRKIVSQHLVSMGLLRTHLILLLQSLHIKNGSLVMTKMRQRTVKVKIYLWTNLLLNKNSIVQVHLIFLKNSPSSARISLSLRSILFLKIYFQTKRNMFLKLMIMRMMNSIND